MTSMIKFRPRRTIAGLAAICMVGACGGWTACGIGGIFGEFPSAGNDICFFPKESPLETQYVNGHGNKRFVYVESWIVVQTNIKPHWLHVVAELQWYDTFRPGAAEWVTVDNELYGVANLPEVGKKGRVNPRLEDSCTPGYWRVVVHFRGESSTGDDVKGMFVYPGPDMDSKGKKLKCRPPK